MKRLFGEPKGKLTQICGGKARVSDKMRPQIVTKNVGPFTLTGYDKFLSILTEVFDEYKAKHPEAYQDLTTAGCLCVRLVRGSKAQPSNHCWGTAVDLGYGGAIDRRGDGQCYAGLVDLYRIAKHKGLFWGAGFATEDAMHFEASEELLRVWMHQGI